LHISFARGLIFHLLKFRKLRLLAKIKEDSRFSAAEDRGQMLRVED
jgi:hypothetical protein